MPRFAANLSLMYPEHEFLDRFAAAAGHGFKAVEYLFPYAWPAATLAGLLKQHGLQQVLFNFAQGNWEAGERGIAALPGRESDFAAALATALDYAKALGVPRLHCMAGIVPAGVDPAACEATFRANLAKAAESAARIGVTILIEPLNKRDFPGYFLNRNDQALRILDAIGDPRLKLQFDVYHTQMSEGSLTTTLSENLARIGHAQVAGVPGRHEPDARQEINYPRVFQLFDEVGYDGWIGCEYRPRAGTADGLAGWAQPFGLGPA
jgi:hydroxypyruvate isomerase